MDTRLRGYDTYMVTLLVSYPQKSVMIRVIRVAIFFMSANC